MNIEKFIITVLFIHQTLEIISNNRYIIKPKLLSSTTIGWCFFLGLLILYYLNITYINYLLIIMLILELYNLYFLYWQFCLFGNKENEIYKYNKYIMLIC